MEDDCNAVGDLIEMTKEQQFVVSVSLLRQVRYYRREKLFYATMSVLELIIIMLLLITGAMLSAF